MSTFTIFLVLIIVVCLLLILVIMVQNPKGGGLSSSFGGGGNQVAGGVKKTGDFLDKSTWTLAKVYLEQKKFKKALQAYRILSLKYPEKSSFFASRIKAVKKLQQENKD